MAKEINNIIEILTNEALELARQAHEHRFLRGKWCFIAGFACILLGADRSTDDMDILVREGKDRDYFVKILTKRGFQLVKSTSSESYLAWPKFRIKAHILVNKVVQVPMPNEIWKSIWWQSKQNLPLPDLHDLLLLKGLSYTWVRRTNDKKKTDMQDSKFLLDKQKLQPRQILERANLFGWQDRLVSFLKKLDIDVRGPYDS